MMERGGLDERVTERKKEKEAETKEESWGGGAKDLDILSPIRTVYVALYWPLL